MATGKMNSPLILTLDIGSSSVRAAVYDSTARAIAGASGQSKYQFCSTADGGSEMDADELLQTCLDTIDAALARSPSGQLIAAVASDCFAMSILGVGADGKAVTPIYTYADSRGVREVAELRAKFDEQATHQRVGTRFHTSYLPARILWIASNRPDEFKRAKYWMSFGEYLCFRVLGVRQVSHSAMAWTGLLNRTTLDWDEELISALPIKREQLAPIADERLPMTHARWNALKDAVWFPTVGDGAAANLGSGCVDSSRVAVTVGTSSAVRIAREQGSGGAAALPFGLWSYRVTREIELIGGALNEGGNIFDWMNKVFNLDEGDIENRLARLEPDSHGLTMLPFLTGERAPNWNADARGAILGLTLSTRPIEILRAGMEAVAYRLGLVHEMLRTIAPDATEVIASGGALMRSPTWVQMIADVLDVRVITSAEEEATSRGCALIALKGLGVTESFGDLPASLGAEYAPNEGRHRIYARAIERQKKWYNLFIKENR